MLHLITPNGRRDIPHRADMSIGTTLTAAGVETGGATLLVDGRRIDSDQSVEPGTTVVLARNAENG